MRRKAIVVLAAGGLVLAVAVVLVMSDTGYRTLGSNRAGYNEFVTEVPGGKKACQVGEEVPAGTGRVRVTIADRNLPTPLVDLVFAAKDKVVARATLRPGWPEGRITVPLHRDVAADDDGVDWCVVNHGHIPVLIAGQPGASPAFNAMIGHKLTKGRMRIDYMTRERKSWWSQVGVIIDRFGLGKARHFSGSWPLWAALVLVLASWAVAVVVVVRLARASER